MAGASTLEAAPVVLKNASPSPDVTTVLMSDKLLGPFLLLNAIQLIVFLIKSIWSREKKDLEEIKAAVRTIPTLIHKVESLDNHVKQNVPTRDAVRVMIWEHTGKE